MKRLAIITTHPIQYNAPWFRLLAERKKIAIKVFYTWSQVEHQEKYDPGFGKNIEWDIPLLEGYEYTFVRNISARPGSKSFKGIDNPTLIKKIEDWKPDAILVFGWKFKSHLKAMKYFHRKILVLFRGDSHILGRDQGIKGLMRKIGLRNVFRYVDYALYAGKLNKEYFHFAGLKESQLVYCPHAIDMKFFTVKPRNDIEVMALRQSLNIPIKNLVFLYAGKFEDVKNPLLLFKVAEKIKDNSVHFIFVGNGPLGKEMKLDRSHQKNLHFLDFQNQTRMPFLYAMCDVFVLPSKSETWGLAVNEAMACGKPVLVSDRCGCAADLVEEGKTGFTFRSGDAEDLKEKLDWMIQHRDELPAMGTRAYEKIQGWSFEKIVTAVEELVVGL